MASMLRLFSSNKNKLGFSRRLFSSSLAETHQKAVLSAVSGFLKTRKSEIEHELQFKGENATEQDKSFAQKQLELFDKQVEETSNWKDFGFDGLDEVECVLSIEDALNIRLADEEFHSIHGVQDAFKVVANYVDK